MAAGTIVVVLALVALAFAVLLLISGWNGMREELLPSFRIDPPGPRTLSITLIGIVLPVILIALFCGYLALRLIELLPD